MPYLIGADEAGYGPLLGPLVVSTSVWHIDEEPAAVDLYRKLGRVVTRAGDNAGKIALADSKQLYRTRGDLRLLERGLLSALGASGCAPRDWQQIWSALQADPAERRHSFPWFADYNCALPTSLTLKEIDELTTRFSAGLAAANVRLVAVRSRAVLPDEFNTLVQHFGNKAEALSNITLELLAQSIAGLEAEPILAICDKHGGRNHYQALLQQRFPELLVEVRGESRQLSTYRFGPPERRVEVRFQTEGEAFLPAALASMACKYLREMAMQAFNDYWLLHVPELRPTAGYYNDALRFRDDIAAKQKQLGIEDGLLWRER